MNCVHLYRVSFRNVVRRLETTAHVSSRGSWIPTGGWPSRRANKIKLLIIAAVAATVCSAIIVCVVLLTGTARAGKIQVPQTFSATFRVASPLTDEFPAAALTGTLHKTTRPDGTWQVTGHATVVNHNETVTVVLTPDGAAYFTVRWHSGEVLKQGCLVTTDVPAVNLFLQAADAATPYDPQQYQGPIPPACHAADTVIVQFDGQQLAACMDPEGSLVLVGLGATIVMSDVNTAVSPVSPFSAPMNVSSDSSMECTPVFGAGHAASSRLLREAKYPYPPTITSQWKGRRRMRTIQPVAAVTVSTKPKFSTCIFVHGAGQPASTATSSPVTSFSGYWGSVNNRVTCTTKKFLRLDTSSKAWDDPALRTAFCQAAAGSSSMIQDTVVFAHGTGNLIVAAAVATGLCLFDASSLWAEVQASYNVARLTDYGTSFCALYPTFSDAQAQIQADARLCSGNAVSLGWKSASPLYYTPRSGGLSWTQVTSLIKAKVGAAMCGTYAPGLLGSAYWGGINQYSTSSIADWSWSTCWDSAYSSQFGISPGKWYAASVNYIDVTCKNGDGSFGSYRTPCTWYSVITMATL